MINRVTGSILILLLLNRLLTETKNSVNTSSVYQEIITIQNKTHILCATNNKRAPIYLSPFVIQDTVSTSELIENLVGVNGWQMKSLEDSVHEPVIDKRWEDFQTRYDNYLAYPFKKSFSFSTYNLSSDIEIFVENKDSMEYYVLPKNTGEAWSHFSLVEDNNALTMKRDYELRKTIRNFRPSIITISTEHQTQFKIHNYTYLYSDKPSKQPVEVPLSDEVSCLVVYVSMCPSCYLKFGNYQFSHQKSWQTNQININPTQKTIKIFKGIDNDYTRNPYWEVDIRKCPIVKNDLVLLKTLTSEESSKSMKSQCFTLNGRQQSNENPSDALQFSVNYCNAGLLGKRCNINCKDILDEQMKYCQQRRICESGKCFCAWGYKGLHCDKECSEGEWGINCQNRCNDKKCQVCDRFTGECVKDSTVPEFAVTTTEGISIQKRPISNDIDPRISPELQLRLENFQLFWTLENEAELSWNYPTINKSQIQYFNISVFENSDVSQIRIYNMKLKPTLKYQHKIPSYVFLPSTKYNFTVGVHNNFGETYNSIEDTSPPKIPLLERDPQIECLNSSLVVQISPYTESDDRNSTYNMFVLMSNKEKYTVPVNLQQFENSFNMDLSTLKVLHKCKVNKFSESEIFVGASCKSKHKYNNINYSPLEEGTIDYISIILENTDDNNKSSYKVYFYEQQTPMSNLLITGIMLTVVNTLMVMALFGLFVKNRFIKKKRNGAREEIPLVPSIYQKADFYQPIKTGFFESYVKHGIEEEIFAEQYERILKISGSNFYECPPGTLPWDYICINIDQKQQIKKALIVSELSHSQDSEKLWHSIWNDKVESIVLVTDVNNNQQQEMVHKHFPEADHSVRYGKFTVQLTSYTRYSDYEQRTFKFTLQKTDKKIGLLSFISWTNKSVVYPFAMIPFLKKIMQMSEMSENPVLFLSSGEKQAVGFILLCHISLKNEKTFGSVDIVKTFSTLLKYNINITERQYILAHLVVLENLMNVDTTIDCKPLDISAPTLKNEETNLHLQHMKKILWIDQTIKRLQQGDKEQKRIGISGIDHEYTYIDTPNPIKMHGLFSPSKFLTTPKPGIHSLSNFWKLVKDENVKVIISLNESSMAENELWLSMESIQLDIKAEKQFKNYTWVTVSIEDEKMPKNVEIFLVRNWSKQNDCPDSVVDFVGFFIETNKISKNSNPLLVTCCDGTKASGVYIALSYIAEKISLEGICDICSAVRFVKTHHSEFLKSDVQFSFLWKAVEVFLRETKTYETVY